MLGLKQFRSAAAGVPDLLNWAALIDEGIVIGKDGSLIGGWFFRGPDVSSLTPEERNHLTARVNAVLARLGNEWAFWFDAVRMPAAAYPPRDASHFPDRISTLIEEERRVQFLREGAHFETEHALVAMFTPPLRRKTRIVDLIYDDDGQQVDASPGIRQIESFKRALSEIEDSLADLLGFRRMGAFQHVDHFGMPHMRDELVNYLHFSLTGDLSGLNIPPCAMYLDALIGGQELWPGDTPKIGDQFVCCLAIEGFPQESFPLMLSLLDDVPVAYRFSTRWKPLDATDAVTALHQYRRKWVQGKRGFMAQIFRTQGGVVNEDAVLMAAQTEHAIGDANSGLVAFGYYTPVIVLQGTERETLSDQARALARQIKSQGFACRVESVNTMEAWLGTLAGHIHPNVRRPLVHSLNLADLIPLTSKWPGRQFNPSPLFPPNSPPLMHAATGGATPFRVNLHVGDVGHTLILGPTGSGKSVLLGVIAASFRRYANARITVFDKGRSMFALASACGGAHYDLGEDETSPGLCPLGVLETDSDAAWAEEWIITLCELQTNHHPSPLQKASIRRAIALMRRAIDGGRSLTDFVATVQDQEIRTAMSAYTLNAPLGRMLDGRDEDIAANPFTVFEVDELMAMGERSLIPVLLYLFRRFERSLDGAPAVLILDEAWIMLAHPVFREKIREWLKVLRKANCAVVLATQSLSDASRSGLFDVLLESCPTKILLPNEEAGKRGGRDVLGPRDIYEMFGLNDAEIAIVEGGTKKRHYYAISPEGRRQFELGLGPIALAFVAASSKEQIAAVKELQHLHGEDWPFQWLAQNGVEHAPLD